MRVTLTRWQTIGLAAMIVGIVIGASGIALTGWVAAYDWGCRVGIVKSYCTTVPRSTSRSDIPA
jgi:hypothetical protein